MMFYLKGQCGSALHKLNILIVILSFYGGEIRATELSRLEEFV